MRAYDVGFTKDDKTVRRFAGTKADASKVRQEMVDAYEVKKSSITIEEIDIPTGKEGLLGFLNALMEG